jgi:O-antigen ligase
VTDETLILPGGPSRAERMALRVLQAGAVAVILVASTYKVFELDRFFVPKELVLHLTAFLAGILVLGAARRGMATRVDLFLLCYLGLGAISAALAQNPWLAARALGVSVSGVVVFWAARAMRRAGLSRPLLVTLSWAAVLAVVTALLQAYGLRTDFFSINRSPGGTLGNRNFVAHVAAFCFPLAVLSTLRAWRPLGVLAGSAGVALSVAGLVLTRSRAAWLALAAVLAVMLVGVVLSGPLRRAWRVLARLLVALLLAAAATAGAIVVPNQLHWNSDNPYLETARSVVNYQEGSGAGRLVQYRTSLWMTLHHPLLGVGPGNWPVVYPEHAGRRDPSLSGEDRGTTSNPWPSSDWVAFLSERGLPAFVFLLLGWIGIGVGGWRRYRTARDAEEALLALTLLGTMLGVSIVGAFDAAMLLAWPTLLVWAAIGALWSPEVVRPLASRPAGRVLTVLLLTLLGGVGTVRAGASLVAMSVYANAEGRSDLEAASKLDPGSYRVQLRLSRGGTRSSRCRHARAAHDLLPQAHRAKEAAARCD